MLQFLNAAVSEEAVQQTQMGLWELFSKGGWLMWPLLALGGVTIFIFVERYMAIRKASTIDVNFMNRIRDLSLKARLRRQLRCVAATTPLLLA